MFWFAFVAIILFIIFLIVILVSTGRSTTDKNLRSLKEELEEKNKRLQGQDRQSKPVKQEKPKATETEAAVVEAPVIEPVAVQEEVVTELPVEETAAEKSEEPLEEVPETVDEAVEPPEEVLTQEIAVETVSEAFPEAFIEEEAEVAEEEVGTPEVQAEEETPPVEVETVEETSPEIPEPLAVTVEKVEEVVPEAPVEETISEVPYDYPPFDNARTLEEFGLSEEEAADFMIDLIQQVEQEMPALEEAVAANDAKQIEDISHMIKGSATNLGTGGIADVLVDFNTYMKSASDPKIIAAHMKNLHTALSALKEQFQ